MRNKLHFLFVKTCEENISVRICLQNLLYIFQTIAYTLKKWCLHFKNCTHFKNCIYSLKVIFLKLCIESF